MKRIIAVVLFMLAVGFGSAVSQAAQEQPGNPAHQWLNGKWEGPAPGGGIMVLELRVVNDNQIAGSGSTPRVGKGKSYQPTIAGLVAGDKVTLDLQNPSSGNNVKLELVRTDGELKGERRGEEVVYKKLP
jgi:hypothetical protein